MTYFCIDKLTSTGREILAPGVIVQRFFCSHACLAIGQKMRGIVGIFTQQILQDRRLRASRHNEGSCRRCQNDLAMLRVSGQRPAGASELHDSVHPGEWVRHGGWQPRREEIRRAHYASGVVVDSHCHPPAKWPALGKAKGSHGAQNFADIGTAPEVDMPDMVGTRGGHDALEGTLMRRAEAGPGLCGYP